MPSSLILEDVFVATVELRPETRRSNRLCSRLSIQQLVGRSQDWGARGAEEQIWAGLELGSQGRLPNLVEGLEFGHESMIRRLERIVCVYVANVWS